MEKTDTSFEPQSGSDHFYIHKILCAHQFTSKNSIQFMSDDDDDVLTWLQNCPRRDGPRRFTWRGEGGLCLFCWHGFSSVEGDEGGIRYALGPHVSWPGHFYRDSLPTPPPTLLLTNTSWRALHTERTSGKAGNRRHFPFIFFLFLSVLSLFSTGDDRFKLWPDQRQTLKKKRLSKENWARKRLRLRGTS